MYTVMWIGDFLKDRQQRVQINRTSSDWTAVISCIPQGSVLGPTLFLVYINGLPDVVRCLVKLFADDVKIFAVVTCNTVNDANLVQGDLHNMDDWSDKWQIKFNYLKYNRMHLGKDQTVVTYHMNNNDEPIEIKKLASKKIWES